VTLNTYYKPPELRRAVRHADVQVLLMAPGLLHHDFQERLEDAFPNVHRHRPSKPLYLRDAPALRSVWVTGDNLRPWATPWDSARTAIDDDFLSELEADVAPSDPFTVIYTSGSTAEPKGVIHAHAGVIRHSGRVRDRCDLPLLHGDKAYSPMPFFWVGGMVIVLMNAMHGGATVCCLPAFEPGMVLDFMEQERVTAFLGWPHSSNALLRDPSFVARDLRALRTPIGTTVQGHATLGMTETFGPHTGGSRDAPPLQPDQKGSLGWAIEGYEHKIVDPETGEVLADGQEGEICVRSEDLMLGMLKRARSEIFDRDGYYHTGDRGAFRDGLLYFSGRIGEMIKSSGMNVAPREVELVLEEMPEISRAVVVGIPHADRGQEVAAVVVPCRGAEVEALAVLQWAKERLSSYKLPRTICTLDEDQVPLLDSGKVDTKAVARLFDERGVSKMSAASDEGESARAARTDVAPVQLPNHLSSEALPPT
jgi:acyl-CoA synthetase (AMP-forming)/AMP-acid ligase II